MSSTYGRRGLLRSAAVIATAGFDWRLAAAIAKAEPQALVLGNASYDAAPLKNPKNDARLVTNALRQVGFAVAHHEDQTLDRMRGALDAWLTQAAGAEVRFFYFAGHGVQFRGRNYALPVDVELEYEAEIAVKAIDVSEIAERLGRVRHGVNIVVMDACRDAPFPLTRRLGVSRARALVGSVQPGLSAFVPAQGTVIAFSTAPGAVAFDGSGGNSSYTKHLAHQIGVTGQTVEAMFKRVRASVARETANRQVPWETSSLIGEFCLRPSESGMCGGSRSDPGTVNLGRR